MTRTSLSYKPRLEKSTFAGGRQANKSQAKANELVNASKSNAAAAARYAAQAQSDVGKLTQAQKADAARLSSLARKPATLKPGDPMTLAQVAQALAGNMPKPAAVQPTQAPLRTGIEQTAQKLAPNFIPQVSPYQVPQGTTIIQNAQDLAHNFIPQKPPPPPYVNPGFNVGAPPTSTILPDTYYEQVRRIIDRATAAGQTLPDTIQGMLNRLNQQYTQAPQIDTGTGWEIRIM